MIKGWHYMYYNDLAQFTRLLNWCADATNMDETRKRQPVIPIILAGPFTKTQKALTLKKTRSIGKMWSKQFDGFVLTILATETSYSPKKSRFNLSLLTTQTSFSPTGN